ncbi:MAG: rhodanese-like domain-containing protein [Planctomycetota bacterium]
MALLACALLLPACTGGISDADLVYLSPLEAAELLDADADPPAGLIDLRTAEAYETRRLPGAARLPVYNIGGPPRDPWRNTSLIVYAEPDGLLAAAGAKKLLKAGYDDVYVLRGGVQAWAQAGLPIESGPSELDLGGPATQPSTTQPY